MSSGNGTTTTGEALILGDAIIYLRMSDFRDEDVRTFGERERQLRDFAAGLGVPAERVRVAIENDAGNGGYRPASAYKRPVRVTTATGLVTMRTRRPVFARVLLDLQTGKAGVLICDDVSRIARDERDALDLIDACELGRASAFSPSEDSADGIGSLRITRGGTREEIRSFRERARAAHDYSADISDKVQRGRKRWAGKSYWGGRRPYGRMIDPAAPKHAKRLITVPEEAKVLQDASAGQFSAASAWACAMSASSCSGPVLWILGQGCAHHVESRPTWGTYQMAHPGWRRLSSSLIRSCSCR
jgi:DNA invertase Pin-like site-specific DNA recombinase